MSSERAPRPAAGLADRLAEALVNLDGWLQTMRQPSGYAGPVVHWWDTCYQFAGPALDWRYEGILLGYADLAKKTPQDAFGGRVAAAAGDLMRGQGLDGSYPKSRFESNPGGLGTPHEAAATHGLIAAGTLLDQPDAARRTAMRSLDHIIAALWDPGGAPGFRDGSPRGGRVPNKSATIADALLSWERVFGPGNYLPYAEAALDDVLRRQVRRGRFRGAVHQWAPNGGRGDGRFFPYYNARCVPPLVTGARMLADGRYRDAAEEILCFLDRCRNADGSWPQILYANGAVGEYPHWIAPMADILLAYEALQREIPAASLERLLAGQLPSGGFCTAEGFSAAPAGGRGIPDVRDITPVVGWNDKVLRLLARLLPPGARMPRPGGEPTVWPVRVGSEEALFVETADAITVLGRPRERVLYRWRKTATWATVNDVRLLAL